MCLHHTVCSLCKNRPLFFISSALFLSTLQSGVQTERSLGKTGFDMGQIGKDVEIDSQCGDKGLKAIEPLSLSSFKKAQNSSSSLVYRLTKKVEKSNS